MQKQSELATRFRALHVKGDPVILFNIWDAGSAGIVAEAGAKAIATGSLSVAMAYGYADGENIPLDLSMSNIRRIVDAVELPVSVDLEGGYGPSPDVVAGTVTRAMEAGAVGFNFEDQVIGGTGLYEVADQILRIAAARRAVDNFGKGGFLNARTDVFLKAKPDAHDQPLVAEALERARAYAEAGADGLFAPGLADEALISQLCEASPLPVNIMALPHVPDTPILAGLGVARISYGPVPYWQMAKWLGSEARQARKDCRFFISSTHRRRGFRVRTQTKYSSHSGRRSYWPTLGGEIHFSSRRENCPD